MFISAECNQFQVHSSSKWSTWFAIAFDVLHHLSWCIYICMYVSYIRRINVYVICDIWKMMCIICLSTFVICVTCKWLIDDLITCNSHLIYSIHTIDSKGIWAADKGFGSCQMFVLTPETNVSVRKRFVFHKLTNLCWHPYCWLGVISFGGIP